MGWGALDFRQAARGFQLVEVCPCDCLVGANYGLPTSNYGLAAANDCLPGANESRSHATHPPQR